MTSPDKTGMIELAERLERMGRNAQRSADAIWGWRSRDKIVSRAFGALARDLGESASAIRKDGLA